DADPLKTPLAAPSRRRLNLSCNASEPPLRNSLSSPKNFEDGQRQQSQFSRVTNTIVEPVCHPAKPVHGRFSSERSASALSVTTSSFRHCLLPCLSADAPQHGTPAFILHHFGLHPKGSTAGFPLCATRFSVLVSWINQLASHQATESARSYLVIIFIFFFMSLSRCISVFQLIKPINPGTIIWDWRECF
ncbi:MAG: hypothetical protein AAF636_23405, partial [Pseudomonadota bacterium]